MTCAPSSDEDFETLCNAKNNIFALSEQITIYNTGFCYHVYVLNIHIYIYIYIYILVTYTLNIIIILMEPIDDNYVLLSMFVIV